MPKYRVLAITRDLTEYEVEAASLIEAAENVGDGELVKEREFLGFEDVVSVEKISDT